MKIKKLYILLMFLVLTGCGGSILDESSLGTNSIQIQGITVTSGSTTASVLWTTDVPATHQILYGTVSGNYTLSTAESTTEATTHLVELSALVTDQTYYYIIVCSSGGYEIAQSGEFSFSTSSTISVNSLGAGSITTSSAVITWTTGVETTHIVEYGTTAGVYTQSTIQSDTASTSHSVSLSGLTSGTEYFFRVKNFHATLPYATSTGLSFTTITDTEPTLSTKIRGIWIVGGVSGNTVGTAVGQVDLYDPVENEWYASVTAVPVPVSFAGAVSYVRSSDGHHLIIIIGGFDASGNTKDNVQIYDIENNSWSAGTPMTQARANIIAARVYDKVYIFGGSGAATATTSATTWAGTQTNYMYTIGSGWTTKAAFASAVNTSDRFTYVYDDVIYNIAGRNGGATFAASPHDGFSASYPAAAGTTTATTEVAINIARTGLAGAVWHSETGPSKLILIGGYTVLTGSNQYFIVNNSTTTTPQSYVYFLNYPFTLPSAWTLGVNNYPRTVGFASAVVKDDIMYCFGGAESLKPADASGQSYVYALQLNNTLSGNWNTLIIPSMPVGRYGHTALVFE
jgi:hypothetical protein